MTVHRLFPHRRNPSNPSTATPAVEQPGDESAPELLTRESATPTRQPGHPSQYRTPIQGPSAGRADSRDQCQQHGFPHNLYAPTRADIQAQIEVERASNWQGRDHRIGLYEEHLLVLAARAAA